jgi:UDP-N-acetylmuramyl pentapeptide phosphotransferase/UDP-N-acetylglucosamine-1-phosphate transferase
MLSSKNRPSQLIVTFILIVVTGCAIFLQPKPSHPYAVITTSEDLQITYLLNVVPSKENCEETLERLADALLAGCPGCSIQTQQCLTKLDSQQQAYLSAAPLPLPSAHLPNGIAIYASAQPDTALTACLDIEKKSAQNLSKVTCYPSNTARPTPQFVKVSWANNLLTISLILAATGALSWLVCYLIIRYEHLHAHFSHDHNDSGPQKFHATPTPRIGGIAIFSGLLMGAGIVLILHPASSFANDNFGYLLLAAIPAFMGGLLEDITKNVGVLQRLVLTMISGAIGAWLLGATLIRLDIPYLDTALHWLPFAILLTVFAVGGVANAINIIDGYNGLAGGFAVIALIAMAWVAAQVNDNLILVVSISMIGALLGFLAWNWPKGKIFLGDGGAYLVGFMLAELSVLLIARNPSVSPWFPLLLLSYPIFETLFSIYRRKWLRNSTPGHPDALHLHQLLFKRVIHGHMTGSHPILKTQKNSRVAPFFWLAASLISIFAAIFWQSPPILMMAALTGCAFYVLFYRRMTKLGGMSWLGKRK